MTAAIHSVELCIPGTVGCHPTANHWSLSKPSVVTLAARKRIAAEITCEQKLCSLLVIATCIGFAVIVSYSLRERELASMQWEAARPVLLAGLISLVYLHFHFRGQRRFAMTAPVAVAEVIERRVPRYQDQEATQCVPRLLLRFVPQADAQTGGSEEHLLWAELDGFSANFERNVQAGDRVSILYDAADPRHVRVMDA